ncbi:polysaccharide deacetylase family protein [Ruegeria arenilitoris]|uniref:polysaccharide deacetylase family protein n=1 Tax=Ruegeria arenilitoris TaxID=1173585 RepID=UPI001480226B|nr:polysaccharide deacetylase family protein [Ruegeria arenilitoris]
MGILKQTAISVLSGGPVYLALRTYALRKNPTLILCYHTLGPDNEIMDAWTVARASQFRQHIRFLRQHFKIVGLDQALNPEYKEDKPRAVLTFDDGDIGLFTHLLPIIEAKGLPVTLYVATEQIETGKAYWFDRIMNALQAPGETEVTIEFSGRRSWTVGPETGPERWAIISDILETLKQVSPERREELTQSILEQVKTQRTDFTKLEPLSRAQLEELAINPNVVIGCHSHCHNLLDQIPLDQAEESIRKSRSLLQSWTGQSIEHFAYPNGNHSPALHQIVRQAGFTSATILGQTLCQPSQDNVFALPRVLVGRYDSLKRLRLRFIGY